ncbi:hypothetical protein ASG89_30485 [Paenibacillus sp. Soil766]|uniref:hypothetical protein n=1 Tax=Paenibacillus sp. Soil766 TaxID=1736404 RepID=UPI00070B8373|nr:hypothetical protein [Paenibacillus sp. Soil766]KRE96863.1 hypothetical protein ASG89_30485 [Paenibacillus sp. Soil766]
MGWSELQMVPNEYNDKMKKIDESLLQLLTERKSLAKGRRFYPQKEVLQEWSTRFGIEIPQINWLLNSLNENYPVRPNEPGELEHVMPIMKKTVVGDFAYTLTHAMQHQHSSIVYCEIKLIQLDGHFGNFRPQLQLDVRGAELYRVMRNGASGGGGQTQITFLITPRLPDNLEDLHFALIPYASPMESPPKEIILDQEVQFD